MKSFEITDHWPKCSRGVNTRGRHYNQTAKCRVRNKSR